MREKHSENQAIMHGETPFTSAPSSPGRSIGPSTTTDHMAYFFSAPASPTHFLLSSSPSISTYTSPGPAVDLEQPDFEFGVATLLMNTADRGVILQRPDSTRFCIYRSGNIYSPPNPLCVTHLNPTYDLEREEEGIGLSQGEIRI